MKQSKTRGVKLEKDMKLGLVEIRNVYRDEIRQWKQIYVDIQGLLEENNLCCRCHLPRKNNANPKRKNRPKIAFQTEQHEVDNPNFIIDFNGA